jgi:uncharacterized protein YdaU (DUF1376 family)
VNKPPAFQFYAKDWLSSTGTLTPAGRGVFITLMAWSWDNGPLPDSSEKRARLSGVSRTIERKIWSEIAPFWKLTDAGWVLPRLERHRQELAEYHAEQAEKGRKGGQATARNRVATPAAPAAIGPHPESSSSSSSSSSEDQEQDQEQRATRAIFPETAGPEILGPKNGQRGNGFTRLVAPTENPAALCKIAGELRRQYPNDPLSEWNAKIREAAAKAGIFYDGPGVTLAMIKAGHALKEA